MYHECFLRSKGSSYNVMKIVIRKFHHLYCTETSLEIFLRLHQGLEKAMATHSSTLAWRGGWWAAVHGVDTTERLHFHFPLSCIGEGNGNPLRCSCLENPRDRRAWWVAVYGVAQSRTRLKQLSSSSSRPRS